MTAPLEWQPLWDAMDAAPEDWIQTTEFMFYEMLECVQPRAQVRGAFLVGEALRHNESGQAVYACFKEAGSSFFACNMTVDQFKGVFPA